MRGTPTSGADPETQAGSESLAPPQLAKAAMFGMLLIVAAGSAHAAKADKSDKPEKPDQVEKVDRIPKSERAGRSERAERSSETRSSTTSTPTATPTVAAGSTSATSSRTASGSTAAAGASSAAFEPFRLIVERNIFNPNRTGRTRVSDETPAVRVDQIALVGTMESDKGLVAFFDSGNSEYQKTARVGDSIAGFTVKEITATGVQLAGAEKPLALRVNQQLRRVEGGDWRVSARDPARTDVARASDSSVSPTPAIPANASEVLRRLMEQRQKQLKQ